MPCPLDPSHTVYARALEAHLRVCNAGRNEAALERAPYFRRDANSGVADRAADSGEGAALDVARLRERVGAAYARLEPEYLAGGSAAPRPLRHASCEGLFEAAARAKSGHATLRHVAQQASIVGHMGAAGLLAAYQAAHPKA